MLPVPTVLYSFAIQTLPSASTAIPRGPSSARPLSALALKLIASVQSVGEGGVAPALQVTVGAKAALVAPSAHRSATLTAPGWAAITIVTASVSAGGVVPG